MYTAMYLRKSRAEEGAGSWEETLSKHREALTALARRMKLTIGGCYEEVLSGESLLGRPEMLRLLQDVEAGRYDAVLCMDIDRLGRGGMKDQGIILETFKNSGTKIITPDKIYDLSKEEDEELTEMKSFFSRRELKIITKRLQRGISSTIQRGGHVSLPPYGYRRCWQGRLPSLEEEPREAEFVRLVYRLYLEEGLGCQKIADTLNRLGAVPRRAASFGRSSVLHILKNPVYAGFLPQRPPDGPLRAGVHPAIIPQEWFHAAQKRLQGIPAPRSRGALKNPLAGLVVCRRCGRLMQRMGQNKGVPYLYCPTRACQPGCRLEIVWRRAMRLLRPVLEALPPTAPREELDSLRRQLALCREELGRLPGKKERLCRLAEEGAYSPQLFCSRLEELTRHQTALLEQHRRLEAALASHPPAPQNRWQQLLGEDRAGQNRLLREVVKKILYQKNPGAAPGEITLEVILQDGQSYSEQES